MLGRGSGREINVTWRDLHDLLTDSGLEVGDVCYCGGEAGGYDEMGVPTAETAEECVCEGEFELVDRRGTGKEILRQEYFLISGLIDKYRG